MKKRITSAILSLAVLICSFALWLPPDASAESLYVRKIVSLVYDNSGSMSYTLSDGSGGSSGIKSTYASYAMQAFCGMLNSEDQIYITYMSEPTKPVALDLSASGIQSSVDSIKSIGYYANTPFSAVETAFNKLSSVQDSNPNTEYWLVVITDGNFTDVSMDVGAMNDYFSNCVNTEMPNGTKPQVTFLAIGNKSGDKGSNATNTVISPDNDEKNGIHAYTCSTASGITSVMSQMADRISGRTRIEGADIKQVDERTVKVSSSIPLLNIAILSQSTNAVITGATHSDDYDIPVSRSVRLESGSLKGGAFLLGDSQTVIGGGSYTVTFDSAVNAGDIVALFEPALETRVRFTVNGKEITNPFDLENTMEGDKLGVSFNIYEMGTDNIISPSQLPAGTKYSVSVYEDGSLVKEAVGDKMKLEEYELHRIDTEVIASVKIDGFNPIEYSISFTPEEYVIPIVYTMTAEFGNNIRSVKFDEIAQNRDLTVEFTVFADGVPVTDENTINSLFPVIELDPAGNGGSTVISDGKIVFTPNTASITSSAEGYFDVTVSCTLNNGVTAFETYRVLISEYIVVPIDVKESIVKTGFYGNGVGASFYITKDGEKLGKSDVENLFSVSLDDDHADLKVRSEVLADGTIVCVPYDDEEYVITFPRWWKNWYYYAFELPSSDVTVTLNHGYGTAAGTIEVKDESGDYLFLCVWAPLMTELFAAAYVIRIITRRPFERNATVYLGKIDLQNYPRGTRWHDLNYWTEYNLNRELWRQWWRILNPIGAIKIRIDDMEITRASDGCIKCDPALSYKTTISMRANPGAAMDAESLLYMSTAQLAEVEPSAITDDLLEIIPQDAQMFYGYNVYRDFVPVNNMGTAQVEAITSASIICYTSVQ